MQSTLIRQLPVGRDGLSFLYMATQTKDHGTGPQQPADTTHRHEPGKSQPREFESGPSVKHNPEQRRFEWQQPGAPLALLSYIKDAHRVIFDHTFVPDELRGRGIAAELTRTALAEARRQHWKVVPQCSYVARFIERHPEYSDLLHPE